MFGYHWCSWISINFSWTAMEVHMKLHLIFNTTINGWKYVWFSNVDQWLQWSTLVSIGMYKSFINCPWLFHKHTWTPLESIGFFIFIFMKFFRNPWMSMDIFGNHWIPMEIFGVLWISMDIHGGLYYTIGVHGFAMTKPPESKTNYFKIHEFSMNCPMDIHDFQ